MSSAELRGLSADGGGQPALGTPAAEAPAEETYWADELFECGDFRGLLRRVDAERKRAFAAGDLETLLELSRLGSQRS